MPVDVCGAMFTAFVEDENELASGSLHGRPVTVEYGVFQRRIVPPDIVGSDQVASTQVVDEFLIEPVEYGGGELFGDGKTVSLDHLVLGVHGHVDGIMVRMQVGPCFELPQTIGKRVRSEER